MATVRYTTVNGKVIAEKRGGVRSLYVPDPLGSTVALLDNTQSQTDTFTYWPYGEENVRTGTTPTPFRFVGTAGYYRDSTSKTYVRARHLDTQKGRWLTQDPIGFEGGDWNLYRYAGNNPQTFKDRTGTDCQSLRWHWGHPVPHCPSCHGGDVPFCQEYCGKQGKRYMGCECRQTFYSSVFATCKRICHCADPCPPCPPNWVEIDRVPPSRPHGNCPGDHWHCREYHQNPYTCQCYGPYRRFGGCIPPPAPPTC
jgi:RHS repeat-associated protein